MMIQPDGNTTCKFDKVFNRPNSVGNIGILNGLLERGTCCTYTHSLC